MISEYDLLLLKPDYLNERQVEKEYLQTLLLFFLYSKFSKELVFKGGTALRKFYSLDRFSEDLDFTYNIEENRRVTIEKFSKVLTSFGEVYETGVKRRGSKNSLDFELKVKGPLFNRRKTLQSIVINISMREKTWLSPNLKQIGPLYPDIGVFFVYVMRPEEILAEKVRALMTRRWVKARDVYDLYFLLKQHKVGIDEKIIQKKMIYYKVSFSKSEFLKKLRSIGKMEWNSELSNIIQVVPSRRTVISFLTTTFH